MSVERRDVRLKLDAEWHSALIAVAHADQQDIGEWVEQLIVRSLRQRFDNASVLVSIAKRAGISGSSGE